MVVVLRASEAPTETTRIIGGRDRARRALRALPRPPPDASDQAYLVTFLGVAAIALLGAAMVAWLVARPRRTGRTRRSQPARAAA